MNTATRISPSSNGVPEPSTNGTSIPHPEHPDRDANGRFIKGNPGGVGNPFGRQVAQLRKELVNRLTTEKIGEIADRLRTREVGSSEQRASRRITVNKR